MIVQGGRKKYTELCFQSVRRNGMGNNNIKNKKIQLFKYSSLCDSLNRSGSLRWWGLGFYNPGSLGSHCDALISAQSGMLLLGQGLVDLHLHPLGNRDKEPRLCSLSRPGRSLANSQPCNYSGPVFGGRVREKGGTKNTEVINAARDSHPSPVFRSH